MAEATAGQASLGWASVTAGSGEKRAAPRRMRAPVRQPVAANISESQLPPDNELWDVRAAA